MIRRLLLLVLLFPTLPVWGLTPLEAMQAATADCTRLPVDQQIHTRYLWLPDCPAKERAEFERVLTFHVNSISREAELVRLAAVKPGLYRLDIRDCGWKREVYEKLALVDPYFHAKIAVQFVTVTKTKSVDHPGGTFTYPDGRTVENVEPGKYEVEYEEKQPKSGASNQAVAAVAKLVTLTQSQAPFVRADWFFAQTARQIDRNNKETGAGYYDFLGIKEEKDIEFLAGLDRKTAERLRREIAAIIADSDVTLHNRQILAVQDGYWESLDVDSNEGDKNAVRQLDKDFKPVVKEVYFRLPCGLWGLAAVNAGNGKLAASVPDSIAADRQSTSNDLRIHPGLSCVRCHVEGLRPLDDWSRRFYARPPGDAILTSPDKEKSKQLTRLYLGPLEDRYEDDQRVYARTLMRLTGYKPAELAKAYAAVWERYADTLVTGERFAAELGVTREEMIAAFQAYAASNPLKQLDPVLLGYLKNPEFRARREYIEEAWILAQLALGAKK